jgi:hypothetical protein
MNMSPPLIELATPLADSVSNILLNIYYETAQAESADSVSNILLKIYSEQCPS